MTFQIRKASRKQAKIKIGLAGPSGSGKTYSALQLAYGLVGSWDKIALIDTENGSGDLYSHFGEYSVVPFTPPYSPERFMEAIDACMQAGAEVIVMDSISPEWDGKGGILDIADKMGGDFKNWAKITPRHRAFLDKILNTDCHFVCTLRKKTDYQMTKDKDGKTKVEKVGLKEIQRDGTDYEFTVILDIDHNHNAQTSKDRTGIFEGFFDRVSAETGRLIREWCESGAPDRVDAGTVEIIRELFLDFELDAPKQAEILARYGAAAIEDLTEKNGRVLRVSLEARQKAKRELEAANATAQAAAGQPSAAPASAEENFDEWLESPPKDAEPATKLEPLSPEELKTKVAEIAQQKGKRPIQQQLAPNAKPHSRRDGQI